MDVVKLVTYFSFASLHLYTSIGVWSLDYNISPSSKEQSASVTVGTRVKLTCEKQLFGEEVSLRWFKKSASGSETFDFKDGFCKMSISLNQPMSMKTQNCNRNKISVTFTNIQFRDEGTWFCRTGKWTSKQMKLTVIPNANTISEKNSPNPASNLLSVVLMGVGAGALTLAVVVVIVAFVVFRKKQMDSGSQMPRNLNCNSQISVHEYNYINDSAIRTSLGQPSTDNGYTELQGRGNARPLIDSDGYLTAKADSRANDLNWVMNGGHAGQLSHPKGRHDINMAGATPLGITHGPQPKGYSNLNSDTHLYVTVLP